MMEERMCGKKVLLVLDDVDHIDQLEALAGGPNWFKPGSRIIITTRDEQILEAHGVKFIRDIVLLSEQEAISLFSRYAFGRENPLQGYEELPGKVIRYAAGLPLTIKVLGSFLCAKDKDEWKDAIKRLEKIPLEETLKRLELSYINLEDDYKEIFLDIACILKGQYKEDAIRILECCGFYAKIGLKVLEQRSLIIVNEYRCLDMHDHIEEMAMNIVRREHPDEPNKHSRLWKHEEIEDILTKDEGTEATRCLKFYMSRGNLRILMKSLEKMKKLRYLEVYFAKSGNWESDGEVDDTSQYFPNSLKYLKCIHYPYSYLPKTLQANNLVGLEMKDSRMVQIWEKGEKKDLTKLKFLSLSEPNLTTFDFGITPNLETLSLEYSYKLVDLCMPVSCQKLKHLHISHSKLRTFDLGLTPNIERLSLDTCADFEELHMSVACLNLKFLDLRKSRLRSLDLELSPNLEKLYLEDCYHLEELHMSVACPNLETLSLNYNLNLKELCMPASCQKLKHLCISYSNLRTFHLGLTPNLETLSLNYSLNVKELCMPASCQKLKHLCISYSNLRTFDLGLTPNLESLSLENCADFEELHVSVACPNLKFLNLRKSRLRSLDLELIPNLERLDLEGCDDFVELHVSVACPNLKFLYLCYSRLRSLDLELIPNLEMLDLDDCDELVEINAPVGCLKKVVSLYLNGCALLEKLPEDIGRSECLKELDITDTGISHLPQSIFGLKGLLIAASWELLQLYDFPSEIKTTTSPIEWRHNQYSGSSGDGSTSDTD